MRKLHILILWIALAATGRSQWLNGTQRLESTSVMSNLNGKRTDSLLIRNGDFEDGTADWNLYSNNPGGMDFSIVQQGPSGKHAKITINRTSSNMQLYQANFQLTAGMRYVIAFDAYSPTSRKVHVGIMKHGFYPPDPPIYYGFNQEVQLTPDWRHYEFEFIAAGFTETTTDTRLRFYFVYLCQPEDEYYFDNVSIGGGRIPSPESTIMRVNTGWNLVSVPRNVADSSVAVLLPRSVPSSVNAYRHGTYLRQSSLAKGEGYWTYYRNADSVTFAGEAISSADVVVSDSMQWVLIGSITDSVSALNLHSIPPGSIVPGRLYGWTGSSYYVPTSILPGHAYWVFVRTPCRLRVDSR